MDGILEVMSGPSGGGCHVPQGSGQVSRGGARVTVAPFILQAVGDVERPRANVKRPGGLEHIPGNTSFVDFIRGLHGIITSGNAYYVQRFERYGPIYAQEDGEGTAVFVADPGALVAIARNEDGLWSTALGWRTAFDGVPIAPTYDYPTTLDFGHHTQARRLLTHGFNAAALDGYTESASRLFRAAIDGYLQRGRVSFKREAKALFAALSTCIFMGIDDPAESRLFDRALTGVWGTFQVAIRNRFLSPKFRRAIRGYRELHDAFLRRVDERRAGDGTDLFSRLCRAQDLPDWLDDPAIVRLYIGLMTAAFDTTSSGIVSAAYQLATNPEWQERLREEGKILAPYDVGRENLKRLPFYEWTWKETLRRYPVANALLRRSLADTELLGYRIPAGSQVYAVTSPPCWDPKYWSSPLDFSPERFSPERAEHERLGPAFMPYGAGPHACVGSHLATLQAVLFWHALLANCRIRLAKPYQARHQMTPLGIVSGDVELIVEPA
jgi:cytochrome P450